MGAGEAMAFTEGKCQTSRKVEPFKKVNLKVSTGILFLRAIKFKLYLSSARLLSSANRKKRFLPYMHSMPHCCSILPHKDYRKNRCRNVKECKMVSSGPSLGGSGVDTLLGILTTTKYFLWQQKPQSCLAHSDAQLERVWCLDTDCTDRSHDW